MFKKLKGVIKKRQLKAYKKRWEKAAAKHEWTLYGIPDMDYPKHNLQNFVPYNEEGMKAKIK